MAAAAPTTTSPMVDAPAAFQPDSTEALPSPLERRDSLEKHLQHRPDSKDLKEKHILLDTNAAPALQSKQADLERQLATDSLKKGLAHRPERVELMERNILSTTTAAPALQPHQKELELHMRKDSLEKHLQKRPTAGELLQNGILVDESAIKE